MTKKKIFILAVIIIASISAFLFLKSGDKKMSGTKELSEEEMINYYTCGMHPSVKISPEQYNKGSVNCPICNMK